MSLADAILEKGWKCGNGGLFTVHPQKSDACIGCKTCTAMKGIILEDAEYCRFISGDDF